MGLETKTWVLGVLGAGHAGCWVLLLPCLLREQREEIGVPCKRRCARIYMHVTKYFYV